MRKLNSELEYTIAQRLKAALVTTDLKVHLDDSWSTGRSKRIFDIVIYRGVHPLAVFEIYRDLKNILSIDIYNQLVMSAMNHTNARYGIVTDNNQFFISHRSKKKYVTLEMTFEEIVEQLKNPQNITIQKEDKELIQKLIRDAADTHLKQNPDFVKFIKSRSFLGKIQFDQNSSTYYFSDNDGVISSYENQFFLKMFGEFNDTEICRYTSLNTVFEMLKNLSFRMSGLVGMNDKSEVNYVETYLDRDINQFSIAKPLIKEHYNTISALNNRYITSCSTISRKDDLTLWRLYADDTKGVCLIFDIKKNNLNKHVIIQKVKYADDKGNHKELDFIRQVIVDVESKTGFKFEFRLLNYWKHFFKAHDYSIEEEVRLLIIDNSSLTKLNTNWVMTYTHSILNPVIDFRINSKSFPIQLREILLGSKCPEQETNLVQLQEMIRRKKREITMNKIDSKLDDLKVMVSSITHYR